MAAPVRYCVTALYEPDSLARGVIGRLWPLFGHAGSPSTAASVAPGKLTRIGVGFDVAADQQVDALLGELGVVDLASYEPPAEITPRPPSASTLTWHDPSASRTQYYNVWTVVPGKSCVEVAGRSMLPLYDLGHPLFAIPENARRFVVQPVNTSGVGSRLSPRPC
jgi:hypothetical protein